MPNEPKFMMGMTREETIKMTQDVAAGIHHKLNMGRGIKTFTDEDHKELKEKLKFAIFRRLVPRCEQDRVLIDSKDLPELIKLLTSL